jgi:hypothetical protein
MPEEFIQLTGPGSARKDFRVTELLVNLGDDHSRFHDIIVRATKSVAVGGC